MEKVILSFLIVFVLSFSVTGQTRNTNAGTAEWTQNSTSTNLKEASLNVNGTNHGDAYDGAFNTIVSGTNVEIIERNFTYSYTYAVCILHVVVRNTGTSSSTYSIRNFGNLGSDGNTNYHYSSSITSGCYFVSSDKSSSSSEASDPVTSFLFGNRINRGTISLSLTNGIDDYDFTLSNVTIAAGDTHGYIFLAGLGNIDDSSGNTASGARVAAQNLRNRSYWPSDFYTGLTEAEKAQIMNWDFPVTAPSFLSYSPSSITVTYGESIPTVTPTVNGWVSTYSISPSLPDGLTFNTSTGQISGTPTSAFSQKTYTITAQNTGGSTSTTLRITVNKKNLNVTAENKTKQYDGNPYNNFTVTYNGFISGENQSNLSGTLSFAGNATTATNGGSSYTITPQGLSSANYAITYTNGTLSITPKPLTITAENKAKVYDGQVFSDFTVSYNGFITGEDQTVLGGTLSFAGTATSAVNVGAGYVITPQGLTSDNYDITFVDGELDITLQPLTITAENKTKIYDGQVFSDFSVSYNGFITGEDQAVLGGTLSFAGTATSAVNVGAGYVITPQGLTSDNYDISFVDGELDITLQPLIITAENKTKVYDGETFSDFTVSYDGFITGEDETMLDGSLSFAGTATSAVNVGSAYVITPQGLISDNYDITFVDGALDITLKPLTITADNKTKIYDGQVFSDFTVSYDGFIAGENQAVLGGTLSFAGTATSAVNAGTAYVITPQGVTSDNYDITFVDGELDITLQPLTITAEDKTKIYDGEVFSDFSVSYNGFITGEDETMLDGSLSFAGTATSAVNVGTAYVITPQGLTSDNYDITFVDGELDITLQPLTITAENKTKVYDGETFSDFTVSYDGFITGENQTVLDGSLSFAGTATSAVNVGSAYVITPQGLISDNYDITFVDGELDITLQPLTITAEDKTKIYDGEVFSDFSVSYNGFITGEDETMLDGSLSFAGTATSAVNVGTAYVITPQGLTSDNYDITFVDGELDITLQPLTITAENKTKVYDGETFSDFTVSYDGFITGENQTVLDGSLSFAGTATSAVNAGTAYVITPQGVTSDNYDITFVDGELDITLQPLTITAEDKTKIYDGEVFSDFSVSYNGFITGEDETMLDGSLSFAGTATSAVNVGTAYVITPQGLTSDNYDITFVDGELDITLQPLTITAENKTKVYDGETFSDFTVSYDGFITGENQTVLDGSLSFAGTATSAVNVGSAYVITPQGLISDNYDITFVDGALDITLKPLTITADNKTKIYDGQVFSDFTVSYDGFIAGENQAVLGGTLSFAGTATSAVNAGTAYVITPQGLTSDNYDITFVDGELDITLQPLTITAENKTKVYDGETFSDFTVSYDGFITGEDQTVLDGSLGFAGTATSAVNVGTAYIITPQGLTSDNYDITFVDGELDITLQPLTITAENKTKIYDGQVFSDFTVSYDGFIAGENQAVLGGTLSFAGTATSAVNAGTAYVITPQGLTSDNYDITFVDGELDITLQPLTITAENKAKVYDGQVFSDFTVSYNGFIAGEDQAVLGGTLSFAGTATSAVNVGAGYVITPQGLTSDNYDITFVDGELDITLQPLTITAENKTKIYDGQVFSDFSVSYNGFITGEDQAVLGGTLSFAGTATSAVNVGAGYVITPQGLTSDNYDISFVDGELDITLQPLIITAENKTKVYDGETFSDFTVSYDGFITGEDETMLDGSLSFAGTATSAVNVGSAYVITPQGLISDNYDITFVDGALDITLKPLTITADNKTKIYDGQVFSDFTVSYDGFIAGENQAVLGGTLSFAGTATSAVNAGTAYVITPQGVTSDNYDITFVDGELDITLQPLTITAEDKTKIYDGEVFSDFSVSYNGFITGEDETMLDGSLSFAGTATSAVNVGTAYVITPQGLTSDNYDITFVDGELDITLQPLTITAENKTKVYDGETFSDFTVSYDGFITGENQTVLDGSLSFAGTATSAVNVGSAYVITPQGLISDNYDITFVDGELDITLQPLTITAEDKTKIYDGEVFSDFSVSYNGFITGEDETMLDGSLSFAGTATSAVNAGTAYVITPQGLTSDNYDITFVDGELDITLQPLTITAEDKTKVYDGQVFSDFSVSYNGFITGEDQTVLDGSLSFAGTATSAVNVGAGYVITPQGLTSDNYDITFVDGELDITLQPLTITAENKTKIYDGQVFSDFSVSYNGFITGEDESVLNGSLSFAGTATSAVNVGTAYVITPQGLTSDNYDITFVDGELDITLQPLTITAENKTKVYDGETFSDFTVSYDGFITGEDQTVLDGSLGFAGTATSAVNVGTAYIITPQGLTSDNYDITFVDGELDITLQPLTITAENKTKIYDGQVFSDFTVSYDGFIAGENQAVLDGSLSFAGTATSAVNVGTGYVISPQGLTSDNYDITFVDGELDITLQPLTITAEDKTKVYDGQVFSDFSVSYNGFITGEDQTVLDGSLSFAGTATSAVNVGTAYVITPQGLTSENYDITFVDGELDINKKELSVINAIVEDKVYDGTTLATITGATLWGTIEGDDVALINYQTGTFSQSTAGTDIGVATSMSLTGEKAFNYTLIQPSGLTANITTNVLKVSGTFTVANKIYDGNSSASIETNNLTLEGFIPGDDIYIGKMEAAFSSVNAGENIQVDITDIQLYGSDSSLYLLETGSLPATYATIEKKELIAKAHSQAKMEGVDNPTLTFTYNGFIEEEDESFLTTPPVASTSVSRYSVAGFYSKSIIVSGGDDDNYTFSYIPGNFTVFSKKTDIIISNLDQAYDGLPKEVNITTEPEGISFLVTYNGKRELPVNPGLYQVIVTTDEFGYNGNASAFLKISDKTPPEVYCQPFQVYLNFGDDYSFTEADIENIAGEPQDNLTPSELLSVHITPEIVTSDYIGQQIPLTVFVADTSGNTTQCTTWVNIKTNHPPQVNENIPQTLTFTVDGTGIIYLADLFSDIDEGQELIFSFLLTPYTEEKSGSTIIPEQPQTDDNNLPSWIIFDKERMALLFNPEAEDSGTYVFTIVATDASGESASVEIMLEIEHAFTTGINDFNVLEHLVYPNPSSGNIFVKVTDGYFTKETEIIIRNTQGQNIYHQKNDKLSGSAQIDLSQYPDGIYFVTVMSKEKQSSHKIILSKNNMR